MKKPKTSLPFAFINTCLKYCLKVFFYFLLKDINNDKAIDKTISLYQSKKEQGEFISLFAKIRFWDSPFRELEKLTPKKGVIIDLGCGDGIFANYLAQKSSQRQIVGIELSKERIRFADKGLKNTKFIMGDVVTKSVPKADAILLIHVFHHLTSRKDQEILLKNCIKKLNKGGKLIVAEVGRRPFLKYLFSYLTDTVIVPIMFEKKLFNPRIYYRSTKQWTKLFESQGLKVSVLTPHAKRPFSHIVLIGTRR